MSFTVRLDLATGRTDERVDVAACGLLVLQADDVATARLGGLTADAVTLREGFVACGAVPSVWVSNPSNPGELVLLIFEDS